MNFDGWSFVYGMVAATAIYAGIGALIWYVCHKLTYKGGKK